MQTSPVFPPLSLHHTLCHKAYGLSLHNLLGQKMCDSVCCTHTQTSLSGWAQILTWKIEGGGGPTAGDELPCLSLPLHILPSTPSFLLCFSILPLSGQLVKKKKQKQTFHFTNRKLRRGVDLSETAEIATSGTNNNKKKGTDAVQPREIRISLTWM